MFDCATIEGESGNCGARVEEDARFVPSRGWELQGEYIGHEVAFRWYM